MLESVEHMDSCNCDYEEMDIAGADVMEMLQLEPADNPFPELQLRRVKVLQQHDQGSKSAFCPLFGFRMFYKCLCSFPALCRQWWKQVPRHVNVVTTKLATKVFSPIILTHHLSDQ